MTVGSKIVAVTYTSDIVPVSSKEFLDIQATIECRFTLKYVRDMIITYRHHFFYSEIVYRCIPKLEPFFIKFSSESTTVL